MKYSKNLVASVVICGGVECGTRITCLGVVLIKVGGGLVDAGGGIVVAGGGIALSGIKFRIVSISF